MANRRLSQMHYLGLALALVLLAIVAATASLSWRAYLVAAETTINTRANLGYLTDLIGAIGSAESSQRGYLLTGDSDYLENYSNSVGFLREGPKTGLGAMPELHNALDEKLDELQRTIDLQRSGHKEEALAVVKTNRGKQLMDVIADLVAKAELQQNERLEISRKDARTNARLVALTATLGSAGIFVVVLLSFVQIHRLISTRSRLSADLARAADEFRVLSDSVPQLVWRTSPTGELNYVNDRWVQFSGLSLAASSTAWQDLLHPEDRPKMVHRWNEALQKQTEITTEFRLKEASSSKFRWLLFRAKPVPDVREGLRWYATLTDIDTQKANERSLLQVNSELQQFGYIAAHDLQEPTRNISLTLDLLNRNHRTQLDDSARKLIDVSVENANRMLSLIRDLLAYAMVIDGPLKENPSVDSELCLRHALANLDSAIRDVGGAKVTWDALPSIHIQQSHLIQLFQNLIGNSVKYRKPHSKPEIHIAARQQASEWVWSITDQGIGFDPAFSVRIFKLFKRLHQRDEYPGTGIGLSICERIVTFYGGRIWAESQANEGATFHFTFPA